MTAKALFAIEKEKEITELYKKICIEKGIAGGPAKSEATTRLWEQEDHGKWEEMANELANDVDGYVSFLRIFRRLSSSHRSY